MSLPLHYPLKSAYPSYRRKRQLGVTPFLMRQMRKLNEMVTVRYSTDHEKKGRNHWFVNPMILPAQNVRNYTGPADIMVTIDEAHRGPFKAPRVAKSHFERITRFGRDHGLHVVADHDTNTITRLKSRINIIKLNAEIDACVQKFVKTRGQTLDA